MAGTITQSDMEWLDRLFYEPPAEEPPGAPSGDAGLASAAPVDDAALRGSLRVRAAARVLRPRLAPVVLAGIGYALVALASGAVAGAIIGSYRDTLREVLAAALSLLGEPAGVREPVERLLAVVAVSCAAWFGGARKAVATLRVAFYLGVTTFRLTRSQLTIEVALPRFLERAMPRRAIVSAVVRQSAWQRLFGCGDVIVLMSDRSRAYLHCVEDPASLARELAS